MVKKLDWLILKAFVGPFIATFFITIFVFMMQIIWKYIDDLVGKGLDFFTLIQFIIYASATLVTLALPIAILLSSIMTFGKLGESFELVAIKSSGIPLLRFMRPLFIVAFGLACITFLFANYVIPVANLKFAVIYNDIYRKSPAFDLKEGVFYNGFRGYSIKVSSKDKDKKTLRGVIIYEQSSGPQDNCTIAETGIMKISSDKKFLEFNLQNGYRYEEKGDMSSPKNEYIRIAFKEYNKLFDLSQLDLQKTADSLFKSGPRMQNIKQLDKLIDSLSKKPDSFPKLLHANMQPYFNYLQFHDSDWKTSKIVKLNHGTIDSLIPDTLRSAVFERAANYIAILHNNIDNMSDEFENKHRDIRGVLSEWHKKFSVAAACLVLFFIGAPLGSIIRKGGLGLPLVIAIIFFLIFWLLNIFGEKFVKEELLTPLGGSWLPVFVLVPVGAFLTFKATRDSQLFSKEFYYRTIIKLQPIVKKVFSIFSK